MNDLGLDDLLAMLKQKRAMGADIQIILGGNAEHENEESSDEESDEEKELAPEAKLKGPPKDEDMSMLMEEMPQGPMAKKIMGKKKMMKEEP